ncbi:RF-1 domain-domain-containing protein [Coniella lustricola]|uniref:RF-1 domain-domain-containing protein n=1 Tax=Coniella lustricola TaxID=2025994 RepID=A0A2T3A5R7_9PEZI|nr:RF-1 domain-domain-containing protein [Coniella lustricola]
MRSRLSALQTLKFATISKTPLPLSSSPCCGHCHPLVPPNNNKTFALVQTRITRVNLSTSSRVCSETATATTTNTDPTTTSTPVPLVSTSTSTRTSKKAGTKETGAKVTPKPPKPSKPKPPPEDEITEVYVKGSGPGGQKINKTNSAVQLKHLPTGIVVKCQETRSRSQNRKLARRSLAEKLDDHYNGDNSYAAYRARLALNKKASAQKKARRKHRAAAEAKERVQTDAAQAVGQTVGQKKGQEQEEEDQENEYEDEEDDYEDEEDEYEKEFPAGSKTGTRKGRKT